MGGALTGKSAAAATPVRPTASAAADINEYTERICDLHFPTTRPSHYWFVRMRWPLKPHDIGGANQSKGDITGPCDGNSGLLFEGNNRNAPDAGLRVQE